MTLITIRERTPAGPNGENATISFDNGPLYNLTISDPFAEKEEQELEWYFEKHLEYPFTDQVRAQACANSVSSYGETLFKQVFSDNDVYSEYKDCLKNGLTTLEIEVAGTPAFHRWHWEAFKDPKQEHPLVLEATMVRKNITPQNRKISLRPSTTLNILIVTARPAGKDDVGYRTISRPMVEALRTSGVPAQIDILRPGAYQALYEHLREVTAKHGVGYYHVIHFDVHGGVLSYDEYKWLQEEQQSERKQAPKGKQDKKGKKAKRHLLILDNLESITGSPLAIPNTLPQQEQNDLHNFLKALSGGKTLVLLGSRGGESWIAEQTFADNIYDLPGLDSEAASILAERILERHHATHYRKDTDLRHLLKLLDGFPLALEVVLPNLTHQTPAQILAALQAGDIDLDKGDTQQKTESIIRCIDYSHSNLSPTAQQLLLCLAPFTPVIDLDNLERYTNKLKQQPTLANLPFADWPTVLQEAQNWGLLSPDPEIPISGYLRLQPVLPYFLRNRLSTPNQAATKAAIDTAFRQHYDSIGDALDDLLEAKEPNERLLGRFMTKLEYENLITALNLALDAQVSILNTYGALDSYLDTTREHQLGLQLAEHTLKRLEQYPREQLTGELASEFVGIIDNIARRQSLLKKHEEAEKSYRKALATLLASKQESVKRLSAGIYHQLGYVAQEQRLWPQAEQYYQQALQIYVEFNDRFSQARTYHHLGMVAQEQRQWPQAEHYFQQALQIKIEFNDRFSQASIYGQLGLLAEDQEQWEAACNYFLQELEIYLAYEDTYSASMSLSGLARVWQASGNAQLPAQVAAIVGWSVEEVEKWFREALQGKKKEGWMCKTTYRGGRGHP